MNLVELRAWILYKDWPDAKLRRSMRFNFILALITGLLFCTLATLEVPEFLSLTDDTSNDYLVTTAQESAPVDVQKDVKRNEPNLVAIDAAPVQTSTERVVRFQSRGTAPSVGDFLHSLCNLRT